MKKGSIYLMSLLLAIITISFYSCDEAKTDNDTEAKTSLKSRNPQELIVGEFDANENFTFIVNEETLLKNWNTNLSILSKIEAGLTSIRVFKEDGHFYIRASGPEYSSTILLVVEDNQAFGSGVACTSKVCSTSTTGCIPKSDGLSCTECSRPSNDCTKTVTSLTLLTKQF